MKYKLIWSTSLILGLRKIVTNFVLYISAISYTNG